MERKFLEDLGIASDLVDKIISEHGKEMCIRDRSCIVTNCLNLITGGI